MAAAAPPGSPTGLTSFGFLHDAGEQPESPFGLNSILNRVKSALGAAAAAPAATSAADPPPSTGEAAPPSLTSSASDVSALFAPRHRQASGSTGRSVSQGRKPSIAASGRGLSTLDEIGEATAAPSLRASPPSRTGTADFSRNRSSSSSAHKQSDRTSPSRAQRTEASTVTAAAPPASRAKGGIAATAAVDPSSLAGSSTPSSKHGAASRAGSSTRTLPLALRTIAPAPTLNFASSAHAVTHRVTASGHATSSIDDLDSIAADDGELDGDASRDQLGSLRSSGVDHSHWAAHGWSAIPGFPLSKDILADDARSIHSSSSRFPRSDTVEEQHHYGSTPGKSGYQTSADAFIRRMRGEGLSRKFWMADENAKECRECLTVFTPFRRKHHCRICGQIFCGRCAAHIVKGNRFGYDGLVRVCNFCMRMLEEYDRHDSPTHQHVAQAAGAGANAPRPALKDKDLISAPLEAQIQNPQSQFAANHLFASASAMPSAFAMSPHRFHSLGRVADWRERRGDGLGRLDSGPPSAETSPKPVKGARQELGQTTTAAPFRKGLADDDMAHAAAEEAESRFAGHLLETTDAASVVPSALLSGVGDRSDAVKSGLNGGAPVVATTTAGAMATTAASERGIAFPSRGSGLGLADGPATGAMPLQTVDFPRLRLISDSASRRPSYRNRLKSRGGMPLDTVVAAAEGAGSGVGVKSPACSPVLGEEKSEGGSVDGAATASDPGKEYRSCMLNITPALLESSISVRALHHLTMMMEQTLVRQRIPRSKTWRDVLLPIVLTAVSKVKPNPRESSHMDVRELIKVKRIPGGKATECEYVHGFVCSKNVATKRMAKSLPLTNARVMVVRFPLDYHRGSNQFMSLEPLMAQEHEFIRILVARMVALRPQIVVVEKTVSRLALDLLERAGVVVVWSVKPSAIEAISRCTQADIITSIDRLALEPRLGRCHYFSVETFEHSAFPELRKSFMRFEGTPKDLGCTIVLRGADGETLSRIKRILELMVFVAYNLRLEEHVMRDEGAAMDTIYLPSTRSMRSSDPDALPSIEALEEAYGIRADSEGRSILAATQQIDRALKRYQETLVSSSACIRLPPPYPIARLKQENELLLQLKRQREAEELERILKDEGKLIEVANGPTAAAAAAVASSVVGEDEEGESTPTAVAVPIDAAGAMGGAVAPAAGDAGSDRCTENASLDDDAADTPKATKGAVVAPAATPAATQATTADKPASEAGASTDLNASRTSANVAVGCSVPATPSLAGADSVSELPTRTASPVPASLLSSSASFSSRSTLVPSQLLGRSGSSFNSELVASLRSPSDVMREAEYDIVKERHAALLRRWRRHLEVPAGSISPFNHQRICMLTTTMCAITQKPCEEPQLTTVDFYGDNDETLGRHLEELARNSSKICPLKGCSRANVLHYRTYIHNRVRIQVFMERFVCPIPGEEGRLLSWSYCKVCENATPVAIVTPETWSFSFAKYLELYFHRHDSCKTKLCDHDFYRDQVRYFAYQNLAIRFHSDEVELYEVSVPHTKLFISPETQSNLKNEESVTFLRKNSAYWDSVMARIKALSADACSDASGPNRERNRLLLSERIKKCEADRREMEAIIVRTYRETAPTDVLCLNRVQRALQEKVVKWDLDFIEFEKSLIPTEKDIRRITTNHLKRLFAEKDTPEKASSEAGGSGAPLPPASEMDESAAEAASEKPGEAKDAPIIDGVGASALIGEPMDVVSAQQPPGPLVSEVGERKADGDQPPASEAAFASTPTPASTADPTSSPSSPATERLPLAKLPLATDVDTDATDLSTTESRAGRGPSRTVPMTAPTSPTFAMSQSRGAFYSNLSRADESSCTESELARSVSSLVRRFDSPRRPVPTHANSSGAPPSRLGGDVRRPGMRRGKTEETLSGTARSAKVATGAAAATGPNRVEASGTWTPLSAEQGGSRAASPLRRPGQNPSSQSRVPRVKRGDSSNSTTSAGRKSGTVTPTGSATSAAAAAPPNGFRQPKGEGLKAGPRPIIGRTAASMARYRGSDSDRPGYFAAGRQDASGSAGPSRDGAYIGVGSRVPVARRSENGPGTRSRVSTIAKHFDRISREAERERERQHRLLVAQRAKRARPVAMTRAKVEVFSSIKEAVRDDESDGESSSSEDDGASAADNEDEGDDDFEGDDADAVGPTDRERERGVRSLVSALDRRRAGKAPPGSAAKSSQGPPPASTPGSDGQPSTNAASTACDDPSASQGQSRYHSREQRLDHEQGHGRPAAMPGDRDREARRDASQSTIKAPATAGSPELDNTSAGGGPDSAPDNAVVRRQLLPVAAGSELESDAPSNAASSVTGSNISSTLPSYLRQGMLTDSDSTISLERSFLKTLSGFWAFRTGEMVPLEYPMLNSEHVFGDSEIIFREDEPSSLIAFTLSSTQYNDRLRTLQNEGTRIKEKEEAFMPGSEGAAEADGWGMIDVEGGELESVLQKEGTHFRCEFESGSARLWCKILFAEQFDALRRSCSCEQSFIESLSRCVKWDSSGGKSGSAFLKTRDDRLVVKQLSRFEMDTFSKFAPQYFRYMAQCFGRERRSTLAKIFGCFRIGFRNPQTGKSLKMDCLVMENLFYGREVTKIYDLKGSMRNRHIQETGRANEVLLDENLAEIVSQSPLLVREASKRVLRSALYNDSLFLADMNVMDYSLVVGVDKGRRELVVGIVDFVRTFTWDKRVESFVKETALLGGAGKEPTIITPRQYRMRFLAFLDKSILLTPDYWIGEGWAQ
ncbi:Mitochondrial distribution and morphology protein 12 [Thecaphora frezii]